MIFRSLIFILSSGLSSTLYAYDLDMHYYVSAYIWSHYNSGFQLNNSQIIAARSNQFTDDYEKTLPSMSLTEAGAKQRRNWHFPGSYEYGYIFNTYGYTTRNSVYAKHVVNKALESNNSYQLGMAMHTYLDSFAHEGYAGRVGHASAGHDPDRPHLDPDKFREATFMMGQIIRQWFINNGKPVNTSPIDLDLIQKSANFVPDAWYCSGYVAWLARPDCYGNTYEGNEIPERVNYWADKLELDNKLIPDYSKLEYPEKQKFDEAVAFHVVPPTEQDSLGIEWLYKDWSGTTSGNTYQSSMTNPKTQNNTDQDAVKTKGKALNQAALAKDVIKNPDSYLNGYPYQLESAKGINQLIKAASKYENGWIQLTMLAGAPHSNWDWNPLWKYVRKYLSNKDTHSFLFAMAVASHIEATDQATCSLIDKFLKNYDHTKHSDDDNFLFVETISSKADYISICAKESINSLKSLSANLDFDTLVAAKLYSIVSDEKFNQAQSSQGKTEMVRWNAFNTLKNMNNELAIKSSASPSIKAAESTNSVSKWLVLAEQDFDDDINNSFQDKLRLNDLDDRLQVAIRKGDKIGLSTICSAIATYGKRDLDDNTLVDLLKAALADPYYNDDADELSYALLSLSN